MATYSITPLAGTVVSYYSNILFQITSNILTSSDGVFARILDSSGNVIGAVGYISMDSGAFSVTPSDCRYNPSGTVSDATYLQIYTNLWSDDDHCEIDARYPLSFCTACVSPTSVKVNDSSSDISTTNSTVELSWSGASGGTNNSITGYRIYYRSSNDGSTWGEWYQDGNDIPSTDTFGSSTVNLYSAGFYYQFSVLTLGSAGEDYASWPTAKSPVVYRSPNIPIIYNGTQLTKIIYNGTTIDHLIYNGIQLY